MTDSNPQKGCAMDIETAFTREAISATGTDVSGEVEDELRAILKRVAAANELEFTNVEEDLVVLAFVAGRTYQTDFDEIAISMSRELVTEFLEFLTQRGQR